jgi:inosose dehydratase
MPNIQVGNAPCSWGTLEFEDDRVERIGYSQMLDELVETGYTGTELGDWGFMPTEPAALHAELARRGDLVLLGAFVAVALKDPAAHTAGEERALQVARLLAAVAEAGASDRSPFVVLADDNGSDPVRTQNAGRITRDQALSDAQWDTFCAGAERIARSVRSQTGLRTAFHHHCAGYVETPWEIERFLEMTDPASVGLVFDTGHYAFGAGPDDCDVVPALDRFADRIWYVHFKDCDPQVAQRAASEGWDYFEAVRHGIFCELGQGCVDFPSVISWLRHQCYDGWLVVEQDVLPGMGTPKASARRNRQYLAELGL